MDVATQIKPLSDFLLVKKVNKRETESGIALPDDCDLGPPGYRVLAVGPGLHTNDGTLIPCSVEPGDFVLAIGRKSAAIELANYPGIEDERLCLIRQQDLVAVFKETA